MLTCAGRREEPWELSASRPPAGEAHAPNGAAPVGSPSPTGRDFIDKHIKPMTEDLEKKRTLFMDDASFISEVRPVHASQPHPSLQNWPPTIFCPDLQWGNPADLSIPHLSDPERWHQHDSPATVNVNGGGFCARLLCQCAGAGGARPGPWHGS